MVTWLRTAPGTRPWAWWQYDAPRWRLEDMPRRLQVPGAFWIGRLAEPRRRFGGTGTPTYECFNYVPEFDRGIPRSWVSAFDERYYRGLAIDIHGKPIGQEYRSGTFAGRAPAPNDPPLFESEPAYLDRHGLLTLAERRVLSTDDFEPVRLDTEAA